MNIKEAKEQIKNTLRAYLARDEYGNYMIPSVRQRPVLLIGPPGIGKTQIMEQIASECGVGLVSYTITHHTRQSALGLPFIEKHVYDGTERAVTEYTMSEIIGSVYDMMESTGIREGILFLDEINCVSETLAPMMLQFLQCKTFGNMKLPEGWLIAAAGNPPEYNRSVRDFDIVTLDRVKRLNVEENYSVWKEYALMRGLHGAVISYIDIKKENFYRVETTADGIQFVTARGWEDLSEILFAYEKLGIPADLCVVEQYLQHSAVARDFTAYLSLYNKYRKTYHIDDILNGRIQAVTISEFNAAAFDEKLAVMGLLISRLSDSAGAVRRQDELAAALFADIKELRVCNEPPELFLNTLCESKLDELKRAVNAGQNTRELRRIIQAETAALERYKHAVESCGNADAAVEIIKPLFAEENTRLNELADEAGALFENAFAFIEAASGYDQSLVLFTTEITAGYNTSWFVENFGCDAYFRNSKELMPDDTRRRITADIAAAMHTK